MQIEFKQKHKKRVFSDFYSLNENLLLLLVK
jgi:hypothetical protein